MTIKTRIDNLRKELQSNNFFGYIISTADEYIGEYVPDCAKRLEYITGFTGSNGLAIILQDTVLFFTDGRYTTQSQEELDQELFEIYDIQKISQFNFSQYITENDVIAYDPKIFTKRALSIFKSIKIQTHTENLIDKIWINRPAPPESKFYPYPEEYSGESSASKLKKLRLNLKQKNLSSIVITDPESVCYLFNIRAHDLEFSPILLSYALINKNEAFIFTNNTNYEHDFKKDRIKILPHKQIENIISAQSGAIGYDASKCSEYFADLLEKNNGKNTSNPVMFMKACKNNTELTAMENGHIQDAIAVCEILAFIKSSDTSQLTEYDIGIKLSKLRKKNGALFDSFPAICGYQSNGAVIHYRAKQGTAKKLEGDGLLLIDSGGQYLGATTDVTRTVPVGKISPEYKLRYTQVLKGHISLNLATFPTNKTTGANLDVLARQYLWQEGLDYAHGTGHGVGSFLNVHEGPQNISPVSNGVHLQEGMILSNEPGYYVPGKYGIRIENLVQVVKSKHAGFLKLKNLTLIPYCKDLIDFSLLTNDETKYIQEYNAEIKEKVYDRLSSLAKEWIDINTLENSSENDHSSQE